MNIPELIKDLKDRRACAEKLQNSEDKDNPIDYAFQRGRIWALNHAIEELEKLNVKE